MIGRALSLLFLLWIALLAPAQAAAPQFPTLTGRVVDDANVIPDDAEARLTQKLAALETQSGRQLVVVTLPDLQGYEISDYGYQLGRSWGIGSKGKNDGALLIVAPKERKLRIEVGYGLEGTLTDGISSLIINQTIVPKLKAGDLPGGIEAGVDAIAAQITLPPDQAQARVQALAAQPKKDNAFAFGLIAALLVFFLFIYMLIRFMDRASRRFSRSYGDGSGAPVTVWDTSSNSSDSSWSSSSSDSFSGGGGDFGGGGSSGDW